MEGYRVEVELRISWIGFTKAANASLEATINQYGGENVQTNNEGDFYRIWVKI